MEHPEASQITQLLRAWTGGDRKALDRIIELTHEELHRIAKHCLRNERPGGSVQATALVNEAYTRLVNIRQVQWQDRAHFFAVGARTMRRILVDHARARNKEKRGGEARRVDFDEALAVSNELGSEILSLDDALQALEQFDSRKARVVEMRYFGGLTAKEMANVLGVSIQTVHLDWSLARAWLVREMSGEDSSSSATK